MKREMELQLDLKAHCIETEIKRLHEQAVRQYFKPDADKAVLEEIIDFAQKTLESLDFSRLRSRYPALSGHTDASVVLVMDTQGQFQLRIDNVTVKVC
jgi:hypothetical protein